MSGTDLASLPSRDQEGGAVTLNSEGERKTNRTIYEIFSQDYEKRLKSSFTLRSLLAFLSRDWFGADALPHWNSSPWSNSLSRYLHADVPIPISN